MLNSEKSAMNTEAQILAQSHNSFSRRHCRRFLFSPKTPPRQTMILQNKPNFQKSKTNLTLCSEMTYEENCPLRRHEKQTQNKPNFQACLSCPVRCAAISPGLPKPPRATGLPCEARRAKQGDAENGPRAGPAPFPVPRSQTNPTGNGP